MTMSAFSILPFDFSRDKKSSQINFMEHSYEFSGGQKWGLFEATPLKLLTPSFNSLEHAWPVKSLNWSGSVFS